jgi:hypothetical protein
MTGASGPQQLSDLLSQVVAQRGLASVRGNEELNLTWMHVAGDKLARQTKVLSVKRGVLHVAVGNAPLLAELATFHKRSLLEALQANEATHRIRDLKFQLNGDMSSA